jgi:hypothetical protein
MCPSVLLESPVTKDEPTAIRNVKNLYQSCLDMSKYINELPAIIM